VNGNFNDDTLTDVGPAEPDADPPDDAQPATSTTATNPTRQANQDRPEPTRLRTISHLIDATAL
jgi:hypothetical protein